MTRRSFFVRYNESFIEKSCHLLTEGDLRLLSTILCDDPFLNDAHESIENLYSVEWISDRDGTKSKFHIWYVADVNVDHIEVIAITTQKDDENSDPKDRGNIQWIRRLVRLLVRLMYAFYRFWEKLSEDDANDSDDSDFFDFGP